MPTTKNAMRVVQDISVRILLCGTPQLIEAYRKVASQIGEAIAEEHGITTLENLPPHTKLGPKSTNAYRRFTRFVKKELSPN